MSALRPDAVTTLCLNIRCPKHEQCIRYAKGAELTVADFSNYNWIEDCDNFNSFIKRELFQL